MHFLFNFDTAEKMKLLILFVCLLHVTSSARIRDYFDYNDYQLCEEFEYKNRSINGYHVASMFFKINFTQLEGKNSGLANQDCYKGLKTNLRNYTKLDKVQKSKIRLQIQNGVFENLTVISSNLHRHCLLDNI